jgi:hypothetical protein
MGILLKPAIAHLGKAEHPLDEPDRMFDPGPQFGFGAVFPPLDLIHDAAVTIAAIGEIPGLGRMLPDHRPLAAIGLVTPGLCPCNRSGSTLLSATLAGVATTAWISLLRLSTPKCAFIPKYHWFPSSSDASPDRAPRRRSWSKTRIDYRRIDHRAGGHLQSLRRQVPLYLVKQLLPRSCVSSR